MVAAPASLPPRRQGTKGGGPPSRGTAARVPELGALLRELQKIQHSWLGVPALAGPHVGLAMAEPPEGGTPNGELQNIRPPWLGVPALAGPRVGLAMAEPPEGGTPNGELQNTRPPWLGVPALAGPGVGLAMAGPPEGGTPNEELQYRQYPISNGQPVRRLGRRSHLSATLRATQTLAAVQALVAGPVAHHDVSAVRAGRGVLLVRDHRGQRQVLV